MKSFKLWLATGVAVGVAAIATRSYAIPTLFLSDGVGDTVTIADGSGLDANPTSGEVSWGGGLGAWTINLTSGSSSGSATSPNFSLSDLSVDASIAGLFGTHNLYIWFGDVNLGPSSGIFNASLGNVLTTGSVQYNTFADPGNYMFGTTLGLTSISGSGSQSSADETLFIPYSLSQEVIITQDGIGATTFTATLALASDGSSGGDPSVPEGGMTLVLLGSSLIALWAFGRYHKSVRV
ncbi:MAG TPA: hypothetical protein VMV72_02195 [Verrucomicrobiae bacterium]|nr:hypothetical protein [Verrucomicrobiae bacterium]